VPTLYTAMSTGESATNPAVYGEYAHPFVLAKDEIVEIVVNNLGELVSSYLDSPNTDLLA